MSTFRRSLVITFFSSTGANIAQFFVSLLLARILSPSEIGVFSITVVFVNIAHIFRDFGVNTYLQREPDLTPEKIRAAIGVLLTASWSIAALLFILSGWIAVWFHEPAIGPVMKVLAIGFVFIPFGSVTHSMLVRNFQADKEAIVVVIGTSAYAATCLGLAWLGFGTMSLAWANLVNIVVCALAFAPLRPKGVPWLPSFRQWGGIVHFGVGSLVTNCVAAVNNSIPDLLLGKLGGARQVGLFSRAGSTVGIFYYVAGATVNYGALSYVSQAHSRGESLTPLLNRAAALITGVGWPILGVTVVLGRVLVTALYGPKWNDCVEAIPALAAAAGLGLMFNYIPTALTALGRPYLSAFPVLMSLLARIAIGVAIFDGTLRTFSYAILVATLAAMPVFAWQQKRYLGYHLKDMLRTVAPSAVVALTCMATAIGVEFLTPGHFSAITRIVIAALPITLTWYFTLQLTKHPLFEEVNRLAGGFKHQVFKLAART